MDLQKEANITDTSDLWGHVHFVPELSVTVAASLIALPHLDPPGLVYQRPVIILSISSYLQLINKQALLQCGLLLSLFSAT